MARLSRWYATTGMRAPRTRTEDASICGRVGTQPPLPRDSPAVLLNSLIFIMVHSSCFENHEFRPLCPDSHVAPCNDRPSYNQKNGAVALGPRRPASTLSQNRCIRSLGCVPGNNRAGTRCCPNPGRRASCGSCSEAVTIASMISYSCGLALIDRRCGLAPTPASDL